MATNSLPAVRFNTQLIAEDAAAKGWDIRGLASHAECSQRTTYRFMSGELQTVKTAQALAKALGRSVNRYLIRSAGDVSAEAVAS